MKQDPRTPPPPPPPPGPLAELAELVESWPRLADDCAMAIVRHAEHVDDRGDTLADVALAAASMLEMLEQLLGAARKAALRRDPKAALAYLDALELVTPSPASWLLLPGDGRRPGWAAFFGRLGILKLQLAVDFGGVTPRAVDSASRVAAAPFLSVVSDEGDAG